jgi:hypothetical protein
MNAHQKAILGALVSANAIAARDAVAKDDRPRWANGDPKRQREDGRWETDWAALVAEKFDRDRVDAEASYAAKVFRELGDGDAASANGALTSLSKARRRKRRSPPS